MIFDTGTTDSAEQIWTAPEPGVTVERMDLLTNPAGLSPDTGKPRWVQEPLPAGYDWTRAEALKLSVDDRTALGARVDVGQVLRESAQHLSDSFLFGQRG